MQGIEATLHDLGTLYHQVTHLVHGQGEVIQRIDQHFEEVHVNVSRGTRQLEYYLQNLSSGQWLMIKIFAFLLVLIVLFSILFI